MIKKENLISKKAGISYSQIMLLVVSLFAFASLLNIDKVLSQGEELKKCCETTIDGQTCQRVPISEQCGPGGSVPGVSSCDETGFCKLGCCISPTTGKCNKNTYQRDCSGDWNQNPNCGVLECEEGCCFLGNNAEWVTEANCQFKASHHGLPLNFTRRIGSEIECILTAKKSVEGACVLEDTCIFTTFEECYSRTRDRNSFYADTFCSDPELNTSCTAKSHKGCVDEEEDVYWFDSCGNPEEVAVDCDFYRGTYCGREGRHFVCKDINCNVDGRTRAHGESWCEYDDVIGKGKDPVGSRHIRHLCFMGEEKIEPCSDYRNEICVEQESSTPEGKISQSGCRVNNWKSCLSYNEKKESMKEKCNKNPDCRMKSINMGNSFKFDVCLPQYPPGFDLLQDLTEEEIAEEDGNENPEEALCNLASQKCTEVWACSLFGGCKCKQNCGCHTNRFTQEMNDFCVSLGDCGFYVNYNDDLSKSYSVTATYKHPGYLSKSFIATMKRNAGVKPAPPGDMDFFDSLTPENLQSIGGEYALGNVSLSKVSGALGSPLLMKILSDRASGDEVINSIGQVSPGSVDYGKYSSGLSTLVSGNVNYKLKKILGLTPGQIGGGIAGGIIGYLIGGPILAIIIGFLMIFLFAVKIKYNHVYFNCYSWEPPAGGDCEKCNEVDVPCTEYRCESLGQGCELVNQGTGDELCIDNCVDDSMPVIKPWDLVLQEDHRYVSVTNDGFEILSNSGNGCLEPWTTVRWGIKVTNTEGQPQYSQCKFDLEIKDYDEMLDFFDVNHAASYLPYHKMDFYFPSPEAFKNQYNLTDEQIKELGTLEFYVKCKSCSGIVNNRPIKVKTCINPGPDLIAPTIVKVIPPSGSFVKYNTSSQDLRVFVDEPSTCRYTTASGKSFSQMEKEMNCSTSIEEITKYKYPCNTELTNIQENSVFYIACQDLSENKNTMQTPLAYELLVSKNKLEIKNIAPEPGKIFKSGVEPLDIDLKIQTQGGAEQGTAVCEWEGNSYNDFFVYDNPQGASVHTYSLRIPRGQYNVTFNCEDIAGDKAEATTYFTTEVDETGPEIIRIYYESGLKIITNEISTCVYDSDVNIHDLKEKFYFENASVINEQSLEHVASWDPDYYLIIQCKDEYGNKGGRINVKPYEFYY
jgi:hypothetical protein